MREVTVSKSNGISILGCPRINAAGDICRYVAYVFKLVVDFQNRDDKAQVARDGLVEREYFQALLLRIHLHFVDF